MSRCGLSGHNISLIIIFSRILRWHRTRTSYFFQAKLERCPCCHRQLDEELLIDSYDKIECLLKDFSLNKGEMLTKLMIL